MESDEEENFIDNNNKDITFEKDELCLKLLYNILMYGKKNIRKREYRRLEKC